MIALGALLVLPATSLPAEEGSIRDVSVSIRESGFQTVGLKSGLSPNTLTIQLSTDRPLHLRAEPETASQRWYGLVNLGGGGDFLLALDVEDEVPRLLHVDADRNGDLTDDTGPHSNEGTGTFAAAVPIPLSSLHAQASRLGSYDLWIFVPDAAWREYKQARFYPLTELSGSVHLGGDPFTVHLIDRRPTDGDFTNDGVCIDLDASGRIDERTECFAPGQPITIQHARYFRDGATFRSTIEPRDYRIRVEW